MLRTTLRSTANQSFGERAALRYFSVFGKKKEAPQEVPKEAPKTSPKPPTTPSVNADAVKTTTVGNFELPVQAGKSVASSYGLALLHAASKLGQVEAVEKDAKAIIASLKHPKLQALGTLFTDRSITSRERATQIQPFMKGFSKLTQNLIRANVESARGILIPKMLNEYLNYLKEARKEYNVTLTVGKNGITDAQKNEALALAKEKLGKGANVQISLTEEVDEKISSGYALVLPDKYVNRATFSDPEKKLEQVEGGDRKSVV